LLNDQCITAKLILYTTVRDLRTKRQNIVCVINCILLVSGRMKHGLVNASLRGIAETLTAAVSAHEIFRSLTVT